MSGEEREREMGAFSIDGDIIWNRHVGRSDRTIISLASSSLGRFLGSDDRDGFFSRAQRSRMVWEVRRSTTMRREEMKL